ncbi:hypothetical protein NHX12_029591, partial [Muraenolepis orangiensis]
VEVPDTTQSSPLSIASDMADSPALAIGAGLSQSTAVFMSEVTTLTGDSVYSTGHTHLLASAHDTTASGILLAVTPENRGVNLPETTMNFDPDCFLNNPKQGQTYGGGKNEGCNRDEVGLRPSDGYVFNAALVENIKTESGALDQPLASQSGYVGEGTGLSPSTTLEQMDFSAVMSSACVQNLSQPTHHPSPSLFLQAPPRACRPSRSQTDGPDAGRDPGEAQAYIGLPSVRADSPVTDGEPRTHLRQASPDQAGPGGRSALGSYPLKQQDATVSARRGPRDGLQKGPQSGAEMLLKPGDPHEAYAGVNGEHYLQPTDDMDSEILCNGVSLSGTGGGSAVASPLQSISAGGSLDGGLYGAALPQQGGGAGGGGGVSASSAGAGGAISLEGFEASFGSQFSDLINDFISVEGSGGGVGAAVTGVLMPQEGSGGDEQGTGATPLQGSAGDQGAMSMLQDTGRLFSVTDYSPEWSYPEGGVKVLITGPWLESSSEYSCLFDHISVPAALIQPGVLRCYCPAHDTGLVMLQVAMGGQVISSSVVFEYKARDLPALPSSQHDWLSLDDTQFRMSILERLEQMEQRMAEISNQNPGSETLTTEQGSFEGRVVVVCEKMMAQPCWVSTKHAGSMDLELEVDPLNVDHFSCTPLMWACALGHTEAAVVLYQWDSRALGIPDSLGRLPLNIARSRGHTRLADLLEQLQQAPHTLGQPSDSWMDRWSGQSQPGGLGDTPTEPGEARGDSQPGGHTAGWSQSHPPPGAAPPAKRLKASHPDTQQLARSASTFNRPGSAPPRPSPAPRGTGWSLRQALGRRSLARRILGKERLAVHLRQRVLSDRGEESELLTYQDSAEDLQTESAMVEINSLLAGYLGDVERFLHAKPPAPCPKFNLLSGPEYQESGQAKQGLASPSDWASALCAATKEARLKADSSRLAMSEAERRELHEAVKHALHNLRKHKGTIQEQRKEIATAIQRCYKKYKQYALYKRMTLAAILIQSRFRSFHEQRKFQQSRRAAVLIQQYYRSYRHSLRYTHTHTHTHNHTHTQYYRSYRHSLRYTHTHTHTTTHTHNTTAPTDTL